MSKKITKLKDPPTPPVCEENSLGLSPAVLGKRGLPKTEDWCPALAYHAHKLGIPVTVVYPTSCLLDTVQKCKDYGAHVVKFGTNLTEAHREALNIIKEKGVGTYINGYDNPHVIAADGTIGIEVVEQLPDVDAILIPIGGGGLIAGIATAVKKLKPTTLIYGVESNNCCCFFKALDNEKPYAIDMCAERGMPIAGYNAFHTAQSLIDKVILVKDDWIAETTLHFVEEERLIVERRAATALAPLFSEPHVVPELRNKKYV